MPRTRRTRTAVAGGALSLVFAVAPAALATTVTVRVQARTKTLLPTRSVQLRPGSITRGGAPAGQCPTDTAQGALAVATHGNWQGSWYASYSEYYITGILGLAETGRHYYWGVYVNGRPTSVGACEAALKSGDSVVFAVVPSQGKSEELLGMITPAARAGFPYTVQVLAYNSAGRPHPLSGATVSVDGRQVVTQANGWTPGITFPETGSQTLTVAKAHYVGTQATISVGVA